MTETELFTDMPCEPQVHLPKTSLILQAVKSNRSHPHTQYNSIIITKKLSASKFPVFLVNSQTNSKQYVMKVFPQITSNNLAKFCFQNELRFASFNHPHVIKTIHFEPNTKFPFEKSHETIAYTLLEHAPYGDFSIFLTKHKEQFNDILIRTYFRHLIDGLEYIHGKGSVHLDIKLDNLLLGEDFSLKIADFDLSASIGDANLPGKGTKFFRAPEVVDPRYKALPASDIYSAGIVLFLLKSGGILPHSEGIYCKGTNLFDLLNQKNEEFWRMHCRIQNKDAAFFDEEFKELFNSMMRLKPEERATVREIKGSKWYNGRVYTREELKGFAYKNSL